QVLKEAGYTAVYSPDGELVETRDARGNKVPTLLIKTPTGWSDWESIVRLVVQNLRDVGIDVREKFVDGQLYYPALYGGEFDLILHTASPAPSPSKPWSRFEAVLTSQEWAPEGEKMYKNVGRFNRPGAPGSVPRIQALIDEIPTLKEEKDLV